MGLGFEPVLPVLPDLVLTVLPVSAVLVLMVLPVLPDLVLTVLPVSAVLVLMVLPVLPDLVLIVLPVLTVLVLRVLVLVLGYWGIDMGRDFTAPFNLLDFALRLIDCAERQI